jgi:hypothetical protein
MEVKVTSEDRKFSSVGEMILQLEEKSDCLEEWDFFFQSLYNNPYFGKV